MSSNGSEHKGLAKPDPDNLVGTDTEQDYTADKASNRALYINLWLMKYGTADPLQGAAILLSLILLALALVSLIVGFFNADWAKDALAWLVSPLMLSIGVAVGRSGNRE